MVKPDYCSTESPGLGVLGGELLTEHLPTQAGGDKYISESFLDGGIDLRLRWWQGQVSNYSNLTADASLADTKSIECFVETSLNNSGGFCS